MAWAVGAAWVLYRDPPRHTAGVPVAGAFGVHGSSGVGAEVRAPTPHGVSEVTALSACTAALLICRGGRYAVTPFQPNPSPLSGSRERPEPHECPHTLPGAGATRFHEHHLHKHGRESHMRKSRPVSRGPHPEVSGR